MRVSAAVSAVRSIAAPATDACGEVVTTETHGSFAG
jgi:hypothetical protein